MEAFAIWDEPSIVTGGNKSQLLLESALGRPLNRQEPLIMHFAGLVGVLAESNPDTQ